VGNHRRTRRNRRFVAAPKVSVTDLSVNEATGEYSVSYCYSPLQGENSVGVDLRGGIICKNISIQPFQAERLVQETQDPGGTLAPEQCLVIISLAFRFDSWYGCMAEYFCPRHAMALAEMSMQFHFHELLATVEAGSVHEA
jgi:hypothetical protein